MLSTDLLINQISWLVALMLLGVVAGRALKVKAKPVADLIIYIIAPVVMFYGVVNATLSIEFIFIPLFFFLFCAITCFIALFIGKKTWADNTANLFALASSSANTGYFGLPVALLLFGNEGVAILIIAIFGFNLAENTVGFYVTARGRFTWQKSLQRVLRLPILYAFIAAVTLNILGFTPSTTMIPILDAFLGAFTVLGMMVIGIGLARIRIAHFDIKFVLYCLVVKFIYWPGLMVLLLIADNLYFQIFSPLSRDIMLLLACVPMAANTVGIASVLRIHPEKAALAVVTSTIAAIIVLPVLLTWAGPLINSTYLRA